MIYGFDMFYERGITPSFPTPDSVLEQRSRAAHPLYMVFESVTGLGHGNPDFPIAQSELAFPNGTWRLYREEDNPIPVRKYMKSEGDIRLLHLVAGWPRKDEEAMGERTMAEVEASMVPHGLVIETMNGVSQDEIHMRAALHALADTAERLGVKQLYLNHRKGLELVARGR